MNVILLKHFDFDDPAVFTDWAEKEGHRLTILNPTQETPDAALLGHTDLLIVGGSPAGAYEDEKYPWLAPEKAFVREAIDRGVKVFGICFGAQMLAELLGGRVYPHSRKEIGWHEIARSAERHPALASLPENFRSLQWHGDTFDLPPGAVRLASSEHCVNQAYACGDRILAVQFHLETSQSCLRTMLDTWSGDLLPAAVSPSIQSGEEIVREFSRIEESFALLHGILNDFAAINLEKEADSA
ncbi:type 1 glutamine amidotransferase [Saccharibacillus sp. CPCC 101409]|uniref:type 1 glutamine amidotransferase n=1 Tax=Saccharibacillus sp. CPCC 101409 TaxID=3058041 RepID=UPI00267125AB|nr:type 1 glutamine amidotransferase [Saccharibacillus sp. CPCC 101409]MDO3411192.1 type 1 glutamine amidotransferase [Saccharibacillus sp. CPCC 101409]